MLLKTQRYLLIALGLSVLAMLGVRALVPSVAVDLAQTAQGDDASYLSQFLSNVEDGPSGVMVSFQWSPLITRGSVATTSLMDIWPGSGHPWPRFAKPPPAA